MTAKLPKAGTDLIAGNGPMAPEFYRYFLALSERQAASASASDVSDVNARLDALQAEIDGLPDPQTIRVLPPLILNDGVLRILESKSSTASGRSLPQSWVFA